ncbi:PilT/PilU family type 4a pilus ATPase [Arenicella xantha]|uniref:Twitching motility protein PilU n=1 Tax=Arenicella xantha TaxID=644221 RepID=A0A395JTI8_9GAMM|nr:PilT/PilU family type 4a pilus ATPase [Arenicella xantha]RBP53806.1 twitching motility protein PilU [Arenicella xantha]
MLDALLKLIVEKDGSDLYLSVGAPPSMKVQGRLLRVGKNALTATDVRRIALEIMASDQAADFEKKPEMNLAIDKPEIGRFRVNVFKQRSDYAIVIRVIKTDIPNFKDLGLPDSLTELIMSKRGLILFVGGTGSGKSTSLASLIDHRNMNHAGHIITIEDPIEFVHPHKKSIVNQREVGVDTLCYEDALENTLRQAPDVILIGEIRNRETMEHALAFAETGHLCLSTLHANNANQALDRIINFFPEDRHKQLLLDMSLNMRGIISQRLIPTVDGKRAAAIEILTGSPRVKDLIRDGNIEELKEAMESSAQYGMQTFDDALLGLYKAGKITEEETIKNADSPNNLRLKIKNSNGFEAKTDFTLQVEEPDDDDEDEDDNTRFQDNNGEMFERAG